MNQILYTGGKNKKGGKSDTHKIVLIFVVFIIIFAIAIIGVGANLLTKVKNENAGNTVGENKVETPVVTADINVGFDSEVGGVKLTITSDTVLTKVSYWWDDDAATIIEISDKKYETVVATKQGTHTLKVEVTAENGYKKEASQLVIGDAGPEVTILTDGVSNYVVRVKDDEKVDRIEITLNGTLQEIEVNSKEYEYMVPIPQGDSLIEVTAYNLNGLSTNKKAKITNFGG